jgi:hypothetical protein
MSDLNPAIWSEKHRSGIEFSAHKDGCVYVSFDFNGVTAWEYCCPTANTYGARKTFAKYLRDVADKIENSRE